MFQWRLEMSDDDDLRAWTCSMPDGSELFVEQTYTSLASYPMWQGFVKFGPHEEYRVVRSHNSAVFQTRVKAQETAEYFYAAKKGE